MSRLRSLAVLTAVLAICFTPPAIKTSHGDVLTFFRKKKDGPAEQPPSMHGLALLLTQLEDEIRKYGSITVKAPDVWGESTLTSMIHEYDRLMAADAKTFPQTMQGFIARSDQATLQAQGAMGIAASGSSGGLGSGGGSSSSSSSSSTPSNPIDAISSGIDSSLAPPPGTPFQVRNKLWAVR